MRQSAAGDEHHQADAGKVGAVIVNWNSFDVLTRCLEAIKAQSRPFDCVVVIDNNSDDAPVDLPCFMPGYTRYIRLDRNAGFAQANNFAVQQLRECDWIALINPDAFLKPDWLEMLLAASGRRPDVVCFGSMTIMAEEPEYLDGAGDVYHISGIGWRRGFRRHIASSVIVEEEVFAPCAAAAMYRRSVWEAVGGFDEEFFCYFEDVDLAFRLHLLGYRCLFVPTATAYHVGTATSGGHQSDFSVYYGHRNLVWTFVKNMPGYAFWIFLPMHVALNVATVATFCLRGRARVILRSKWDALKGVSNAWTKRREIQRRRTASVKEVLRLMDKRIVPIRRPGRTLIDTVTQRISNSQRSVRAVNTKYCSGNDGEYFEYLKHRSALGLFYRMVWLYPRLDRRLVGRVLDVGCGIGDYLRFRRNAVGVDVNEHVVSWCRSRGLNVRHMDKGRIPHPSSSFESVVLDNVLEHIADPADLLAEIVRVLVPRGILLVGVPGRRGFAADADHKVYYDESTLDDVMRSHGFIKKESFYVPFRSAWLDRYLSLYCLYSIYIRS